MDVFLDVLFRDTVYLLQSRKHPRPMVAWSGVAATMGPPVGGSLGRVNWKWLLWMTLTICGLAPAAPLLFMRVEDGDSGLSIESTTAGKPRGTTRMSMERLTRLTYLGDALFTSNMRAIL
ncbi:hypothetical protein PFICI_09356 [Pestalotiopsis fici W106-1]|uniref:Major facilitator superfamily (MFS) profile domain-containing protein n=1 Tax=Pestalotiopsis fici (strain W106-1 / CGMCC3.15140) TaxID=1229662 RepID=W3X037_PESFW|nr:uncharacterized protein PFICI_09356 [Pestalotiopsis fici W106-1]ETS79503.1 hypothetical protein PFICI_09356 [Pestalotiopsis fici W106-1]